MIMLGEELLTEYMSETFPWLHTQWQKFSFGGKKMVCSQLLWRRWGRASPCVRPASFFLCSTAQGLLPPDLSWLPSSLVHTKPDPDLLGVSVDSVQRDAVISWDSTGSLCNHLSGGEDRWTVWLSVGGGCEKQSVFNTAFMPTSL